MKLDAFMSTHPACLDTPPYAVRQLTQGVWMIEDGTPTKSCIYVVEGTESAVVIDTGSPCGGDLFALVESLTSLPWILIITHGHPDHASFLDRVDTFYMSEKDLSLLASFAPESAPFAGKCHNIDASSIFDLGGGVVLHTVPAPGHSPGSVIFTDVHHGFVFSGDAFGSGSGVWMQVPMASNMSEYHDSILNAMDELDRCFDGENYLLLPGHAYQLFDGVSGFQPNPPCRALLEDMAELCTRTIDGTAIITSPAVDDTAFTDEPVVRAQFRRASAACLRSRFK